MNSVLHPSLPLASENPFSSDPECIEHHLGQPHANHHSPFAAGVSDQLRREGPLGQSAQGYPSNSIPGRCNPHRPDTHYHHSAALSDTGSGSISASPISSSSSTQLAYSSFPSSLYSNTLPLSNFSGYGYPTMSATRRTSMMTEPSPSVMLPPARSPVSPSMGGSARDNYTTSTPGLHRHALSPRHSELRNSYGTLPETPRSVVPTTMPLSTPYTNSSLMSGYATQPDRGNGESPPFNAQEDFCEIICDGQKVMPAIDAKVDKGFFLSNDGIWTCYRRNYFAVSVHYNLTPWTPNGRLYLNQGAGKPQEQIQSMAVALAAAVDGSTGKSIELIQHTPKRDKGPQMPMKKELLSPMPPGKNQDHPTYGISNYAQPSQVTGPSLPLQNETDVSPPYSPASHSSNTHQHAFERIQFKAATANNGKRRAQQQYYHLIVELWANIQSPRDPEPRWVKVAARSSHPVVVRGRSPSHYSNEGPHNASTSRGAGSGGGSGSGAHGFGVNGTNSYTTAYRPGYSGGGAGAMGGGMYRNSTTYSLDPSPMGSHSVSSASSLSGGPVEMVGDHHMVDDDEPKMIESHNDYQYYPAPIYETIPKPETSALPPPDRRIKEEYPLSAMAPNWQVGGCGRFQGMESSRGYYPDVQAHATGY